MPKAKKSKHLGEAVTKRRKQRGMGSNDKEFEPTTQRTIIAFLPCVLSRSPKQAGVSKGEGSIHVVAAVEQTQVRLPIREGTVIRKKMRIIQGKV